MSAGGGGPATVEGAEGEIKKWGDPSCTGVGIAEGSGLYRYPVFGGAALIIIFVGDTAYDADADVDTNGVGDRL